MKKNIIVEVYDRAADNDPPDNLVKHIEWLTSLLTSIPEECRGDACVDIVADVERDCGILEYVVSYTRQETDQEEETRESKDAVSAEIARKRELMQLAALKAKYES